MNIDKQIEIVLDKILNKHWADEACDENDIKIIKKIFSKVLDKELKEYFYNNDTRSIRMVVGNLLSPKQPKTK